MEWNGKEVEAFIGFLDRSLKISMDSGLQNIGPRPSLSLVSIFIVNKEARSEFDRGRKKMFDFLCKVSERKLNRAFFSILLRGLAEKS